MPTLGAAGTLAVLVFIAVIIGAIFAYHVWMDRRLRKESERQSGADGPKASPKRR